MKALLSMLMSAGLMVQGFARENESPRSGSLWQGSEQAHNQPALAEGYLSRLANQLRTKRKIVGIAGTLVGAAGVGGGIALLNTKDDAFVGFFSQIYGISLIAAGGVMLVGGVASIAVPTRAEREDKRVGTIGDAAEREQAAASALADLARWGRRNRIIWGGVLSAATVLCGISAIKDDASNGYVACACWGVVAAYTLLVKSAEEKTYRAYVEKSRLRLVPELSFGLAPRGGVQVGFYLTF